MPQIAQLASTYASQIFWLLLTFGFVFFVIGLGMVPKIQSTVDLRTNKINGDLAAAKAASERADAIDADYARESAAARAEAQKTVAEAKAKATRTTEKQLATADGKFAEQIAAAEADIAASRDAALAQVEAVAADAARDMVAKVSGASPTSAAATQAVKEALAHV